jgi:hypothetical protein
MEWLMADAKESENAVGPFIASPESMTLAGGVWGGGHRPR